MKVYEYKFNLKGSNGLKARGVCVANSLTDLYWHLDNVADPYSALFRVHLKNGNHFKKMGIIGINLVKYRLR